MAGGRRPVRDVPENSPALQRPAGGGTAPYTFAVCTGALPDGLTLDPNTGDISGTPAIQGAFNFVICATDTHECAGSQAYTVAIGPACLYCNEFDSVPNYDFLKPAWSVSNSLLQGTPAAKKTIAAATPEFAGCLVCTATTSMATSGGPSNKVSFYNHFVDKKNLVELLMKQESGKWILKQRVNNKVVAKAKFAAPINANQFYTIDVVFDRTQFVVTIDGAPSMTLVPAGVLPSGTVGFAVKNTTGSWEYVHVN